MRFSPLFVLALFLAMTACRARDEAGSSADASAANSGAAPRASAAASAIASPDAAALVDASSDARKMSSSATTTILAADASSNSCKLLRPPIMQPYGGPAFLRFVGAGSASMAELVFNESSRPRFSGTPIAQRRSFVDVPMPPKSTLPGCVALAQYVYCPDANGAIHRTDGGGENDIIVATGRAGTPLSVAPIAPDHVLLAYIRDANTSEGQVRMAEIKLDDGPAVHLSEDGSGATYVEIMSRGDNAIALTLDGRTAMTPAHVRIVRVEGGKASLSRDAVVFVGGPAERYTRGRIALNAEGNPYVVIAAAHPADGFGMATVRLSNPPTEDEPAVWSMYPSAVDPAPLAVTHGVSPIRVARARPATAEPRASLLLEVGELSPSGEFQLKCILAEAAYIKDLEIDVDRDGAMWLFWRDTRGSHLERRSLP